MNAMLAIIQAMVDLLAADTATLAVATFLDVGLVENAFTPDPDLVSTDLTIVTAGGLVVKTTTSATIPVVVDPVAGDQIVVIPAPAGGWLYVATGAGLPITLYGFAMYDHADATKLYGAQLFDTPIVITAAGQFVDLGEVSFRIPLNNIT